MGFSSKYNAITAFATELLAVREGIAMVKRLEVKDVELEVDALSLSVMLNSASSTLHHELAAVVKDIEEDIKYFDTFEILHVKRTHNAVAHELAQIGMSMSVGHRLYLTCPESVLPIYNTELAAVAALNADEDSDEE
ncbi:uncharacterized protein LOC110712685 [Chenopodium quinoa]|uniref:uncharacterized protein LOC110712685 n=1 Tax=Chenopodium quinoa TaxID=63459 RepID=UPI000B774666|nr:uncharacterized protein LOC110712685 [Chenopodium quinoa]XP_021746842.1 uncharacterized protein LOC110712685 [Chenopodium quinoa]